jgi:hypothetical protein
MDQAMKLIELNGSASTGPFPEEMFGVRFPAMNLDGRQSLQCPEATMAAWLAC